MKGASGFSLQSSSLRFSDTGAPGFSLRPVGCRNTGFQSFGSIAAVEVQEHRTSLLQSVLGADCRSTGVQLELMWEVQEHRPQFYILIAVRPGAGAPGVGPPALALLRFGRTRQQALALQP